MNEEMLKEFENTLWDKFSRDFSVSRKRAFNYSERCDEYINSFVNGMYFMWKASRKAMKPIKLPVAPKINHVDAHDYYADGVHDTMIAIKQAGHKVEE